VIELLIREFSNRSNSGDKLLIISGLANFPQEKVIEFLITELENQEEKVQVKIVEVLAEIATEQQILELFIALASTSPFPEIRREVIYKLRCMDDTKALAALIQATSDSELAVQEAAMYGLSSQDICLTEKFNPTILPLVEHGDENIRFYAAEVLAKCHPQLILNLLKSENLYTRVSAIRAVQQTKDVAAIEQLLKLSKRAKIEEDEQYILFKALIDIIENNQENLIYPAVFEHLINLLDSGSVLVRQTIAGSLYRLKGPEVFTEVVRQLQKEKNPEVIIKLLRTLAFLQDEQALAYLKNLTSTTEWQTRTPRLIRYKANHIIRMAENRAGS
jgi:HEAT repeat protein